MHAQSHTPRYIKTQTNNLPKMSNVSMENVSSDCYWGQAITYEPLIKGYSTCSYGNTFNAKHLNCYHIIFIFIPWIRTGLQNPHGYENSQIWLRNLKVKSI